MLVKKISDLEIARAVSGKNVHQRADNVPEIGANIKVIEKKRNGKFF